MNIFGKVIVSIIYDSRCGMSDVAFRTAPPTGEHDNFLPEVAIDVMSSEAEQLAKLWVRMSVIRIQLGDSRTIVFCDERTTTTTNKRRRTQVTIT